MAQTARPVDEEVLPTILRRQEPGNPLPVRAVRLPGRSRPRTLGRESPPWLTHRSRRPPLRLLRPHAPPCADVVRRCPELGHIDVSRLLFGMTQARSGQPHGLQARVTPLRFRDGQLTRHRRDGAVPGAALLRRSACEMLYLVTFCLPRFLDQDFDDKFITLFHELYHISPDFEGDLRRHEGRYALHSHSKRDYDAHMADLARAYLASRPDRALHDFLRLNFAQLEYRHGSVLGVVVPRPRLIPIADTAARRDR